MDDRARRVREILEDAARNGAARRLALLRRRPAPTTLPGTGRRARALLLTGLVAVLLASAGDLGAGSPRRPLAPIGPPAKSVRPPIWKLAAEAYGPGPAIADRPGEERSWAAAPGLGGNAPQGAPPVF